MGTASGDKQLCRAENFADFHPEMSRLSREIILGTVSDLFDEQAVLFKEKVNFKLAGGGGFLAHQGILIAYISCTFGFM